MTFSKLSFKATMAALDCSRSFVYSLIDKGILTPFYIEGSRKPYFDLNQIEAAMKSSSIEQEKETLKS